MAVVYCSHINIHSIQWTMRVYTVYVASRHPRETEWPEDGS